MNTAVMLRCEKKRKSKFLLFVDTPVDFIFFQNTPICLKNTLIFEQFHAKMRLT